LNKEFEFVKKWWSWTSFLVQTSSFSEMMQSCILMWNAYRHWQRRPRTIWSGECVRNIHSLCLMSSSGQHKSKEDTTQIPGPTIDALNNCILYVYFFKQYCFWIKNVNLLKSEGVKLVSWSNPPLLVKWYNHVF
jgi:hypothetical protein